MSSGVRSELEAAVQAAVRDLGVEQPPDLELGRARNPDHGDYTTPIAMKLARELRLPPPKIASDLADRLSLPPDVASIELAGPHLNFRLTAGWLQKLVGRVAADPDYGRSRMGGGERVQVEFASINPTGPIHIGHGRGVILGDALSRLLDFTGHQVQREYYVNDQNTQARRFGASVHARLHGLEPPEGGYPGDYVGELAEQARRDLPGVEDLPEEEAEPLLRRYAIDRMVEQIAASVGRLNVHYDEWFRESRLWEEGLPQQAIERLRRSSQLQERAGAVWFVPDVPGWKQDDEDRVVIRSNGEPTYFASDLGYLLSKFERRGFQRVIDVWGSDHHGYVPRMKSATAALGLDPSALVVILNQMVNLKEGKMSKRQGRFVLLDELVDMVGADAVRFFYLLRTPDTMMEFDLELAVSRSHENPVYYAQYAHARLANVETFAAGRDLPARPDLGLLKEPWELALARQIAYWPEAVEEAARLLEPHRIPYFVHDLADRVHAFYQAGNRDGGYRVVVDNAELTRARLELCRAGRNTLRAALDLMGVSAPDRM